jgi:plastocyanin
MSGLKILALGLVALGLAAFSRPPAAPTVIEMTPNMVFLPREMTVAVGEVVVWKNVSKMPHSVNTTADNCKTEEGKKWVKIPTGATSFFSGEIKPDDEFRIRFELPGTYQYLCTFHEDQMMRGTIIVQGAAKNR